MNADVSLVHRITNISGKLSESSFFVLFFFVLAYILFRSTLMQRFNAIEFVSSFKIADCLYKLDDSKTGIF